MGNERMKRTRFNRTLVWIDFIIKIDDLIYCKRIANVLELGPICFIYYYFIKSIFILTFVFL